MLLTAPQPSGERNRVHPLEVHPLEIHPLEVHQLEVHPLEPRWVHPLEVRSHLQQKQQAPASADRTSTRMIWSGRLCSATFAVQIVGNTSITKNLVAETGPLGPCASGIQRRTSGGRKHR